MSKWVKGDHFVNTDGDVVFKVLGRGKYELFAGPWTTKELKAAVESNLNDNWPCVSDDCDACDGLHVAEQLIATGAI